jgi:hypothetical protein
MAAVPMAAPALKNARNTVDSIAQEFSSDKKLSKAERRRRRREAEAAAAAAAATSAPAVATTSSGRQRGEIIAAGATLRARPGRGAAAMNSFGTGTPVSVLGKDGDWYHVRVNGQEGYIYSSLMSVRGGRSSSSSTSSVMASAPTQTASHSSHRRRGRHSSPQTVAQQEAMLVADATSVHHKSRGGKRQVAAAEPILVP